MAATFMQYSDPAGVEHPSRSAIPMAPAVLLVPVGNSVLSGRRGMMGTMAADMRLTMLSNPFEGQQPHCPRTPYEAGRTFWPSSLAGTALMAFFT